MTKARTLADMISDGVIGTTELADDVITPVKLDETGSYEIAQLGIGTSQPAAKLTIADDLSGPLDATAFRLNASSANDSNTLFGGPVSSGNYSFLQSYKEGTASGVRSLLINPAGGSVGIGTVSPTGNLSVSGATYLSSASTVGSKITLNSENTSSWLGTRELVSLESVGNGADHRTGTLSLKVKKGPSDTTLTEYMQINGVSNYTTFSTGGSERMRIRGDGNIHINTTTPDLVGNTTSLSIGGSSFGGDGMLSLQSGWGGTTYGRVFASGGQLKIGNPQNGQVSFYSANLTRLNIRADGDLEIFNTQSAGGGVETNALYWKIQNSGNTGQYARLGGISAETVSNWGGDLLFHSKPANATPNDTTEERMRIMYDGRVCFLGGAGVANPKIMTYKFSGVGNGDTMNLSNTLRFSGLVMVGSDGNDTAAYVFAVADDSYYGQASTTQIIGESNTAYTYQTLSLSSPINSNLVLTASGSNTKNYVVMLIGVN